MEANTTVNGNEEIAQHIIHVEEKSVKFADNNNEGENAAESHVIHAEVNHQSTEEPMPQKRNVFNEAGEETPESTDNVADETDGNSHSKSALPETSENFIKIEERNVIERLSRVIDSELSIETLRIDTVETTEVVDDKNDDKPTLEFNEHKQELEEPTVISEPAVQSQQYESTEEVNRVTISITHEEEPPAEEDNTPSTEEKLERNEEPELTHQENQQENHFHDNGLNNEESNHRSEDINDETFETLNENHSEDTSKPVVEDMLIKQNGRKIVYSSEEDVEEETDQMPEIIGFRSTLKKWSTGKPDSNEADIPPVNSKDKFKTLRQIRKGNTRSLMERFQSNS